MSSPGAAGHLHGPRERARQAGRAGPSIYLSICLSFYLSFCLSVCLSVNLSICQFVNLSICQSINLSIYQSINLSIYQSINLSICQPIYLYSAGSLRPGRVDLFRLGGGCAESLAACRGLERPFRKLAVSLLGLEGSNLIPIQGLVSRHAYPIDLQHHESPAPRNRCPFVPSSWSSHHSQRLFGVAPGRLDPGVPDA